MKNSLTIKELRQHINLHGYTDDILRALNDDQRKGAKTLLIRYHKIQEDQKKQKECYQSKQKYEKQLYKEGCHIVAGMDEAGRGPLAGPVVAAAVVLPYDFYLPGLDDSKQLTADKREAYFDIIKQNAVHYGIGIVHSKKIDQINIFQATKKAMYQAFTNMEAKVDHLLIDAVELDALPCPSTSIIKGDQKSISIAAASVLAKVTRDRWMKEAAQIYPVYGFERNMGYGTKQHIDALLEHGPSDCHRYSFAPVRNSMDK